MRRAFSRSFRSDLSFLLHSKHAGLEPAVHRLGNIELRSEFRVHIVDSSSGLYNTALSLFNEITKHATTLVTGMRDDHLLGIRTPRQSCCISRVMQS
jgi:hypothetical protein